MKLKSYFSESVEVGVELARKELGDEAMLVNARPTTPDARHLGAYEIVFGWTPNAASGPVEKAPPPARDRLFPDRLVNDVAEMKLQIERLGGRPAGGPR